MVKRGIWKEKEYVPTSEDKFQAQQETIEGYENWKDLTAKQIEEKIEDDWELEDDDYMKEYREKRMAELKQKAEQHKFDFGMIEINKQEYEWHVKNMPPDTLGVILMYQDYVLESRLLREILEALAQKHKTRKFMKIVATKCVENFEDVDVPCLLFYKNGELYDQIAGTKCREIFGGKRMTLNTVEYVLAKEKKFLEMEFEDDPRDSLKTFNAFIHKKKAFLGKNED
mmetsp:Transcript_13932/g.23698  ORF Transcript_13932/g.23698 Transcript_13932/m.23698 type:complete len:227 (-) Transcript_13932:136-816(-)|eukprot:CAMPEP_0168622928 /NCGR_PEP_ID=MMETSP0449_2-20121227/8543_1 /TAXON_ID=1082188 /ORGANISM="Strombidium rassoulzadegani, Strain ras09" /LENGTH=226 /DNA_ID=CAMNT_0008664255 /DNA_START=40 /DNA_END=720 /DNA_ORIENTATION=+